MMEPCAISLEDLVAKGPFSKFIMKTVKSSCSLFWQMMTSSPPPIPNWTLAWSWHPHSPLQSNPLLSPPADPATPFCWYQPSFLPSSCSHSQNKGVSGLPTTSCHYRTPRIIWQSIALYDSFLVPKSVCTTLLLIPKGVILSREPCNADCKDNIYTIEFSYPTSYGIIPGSEPLPPTVPLPPTSLLPPPPPIRSAFPDFRGRLAPPPCAVGRRGRGCILLLSLAPISTPNLSSPSAIQRNSSAG